jgi:phage tail sheath protein FI
MPSSYTYPGIYIEEVPSGVHTIAGVSTSDTAFVDVFPRGPVGLATRVTGFEDFTRKFGGLWEKSEASFAIQQYFLNGGQIAWVVRVNPGDSAVAASCPLTGGSPPQNGLVVEAASPGFWGNSLEVGIDYLTRDPIAFPNEFNLAVREVRTVAGNKQVLASETHRNVSLATTGPRFFKDVLLADSELLRVTSAGVGGKPAETETSPTDVTSPQAIADGTSFQPLTSGTDSSDPDSASLEGGFAPLEKIAPSHVNLLCVPAAADLAAGGPGVVYTKAIDFCERNRAFLFVDIPESIDLLTEVQTWVGTAPKSKNAATYFPRLEIPNPLNENRPRNVAASGTLAGIYARTDSARGIWKAPAGTETALRGATLPEKSKLTDAEHGAINPIAINALRTFPVYGTVTWGARTLDGADVKGSEWKYVPVRRTALHIEESLYQGLRWVVFEPNDEPLWSQIRLNVGSFMHDLFRQGAFQGKSPSEAYLVKCDSETTTQSDINRGVVNVLVGFAPLKPAEFVVIRIQQLAGQLET